MSGKKSKAKIQMSKPEPPPFLQRMREQIVAAEDAQRKEASSKRRRDRPQGDTDDDPTIVKIGDEDLTEEEYKRLKTDLETQYKLTEGDREKPKPVELEVDALISSRKADDLKNTFSTATTKQREAHPATSGKTTGSTSKVADKSKKATTKKLSYSSSSSDEDD